MKEVTVLPVAAGKTAAAGFVIMHTVPHPVSEAELLGISPKSVFGARCKSAMCVYALVVWCRMSRVGAQ